MERPPAAGLTTAMALCLAVASMAPAPVWAGSSSPAAPTPRPACPNADGGSCLGPLAAGTYGSWVFWTPITYTVPDGWANFEDLPGEFLLVPPGSTLEGVGDGTSDSVGIYQGVAIPAADCEEVPEPGVGTSAEAMAAALSGRDGLVVSDPVSVTVGRLNGLRVDLAYAPGSDSGCHDPYFPLPFVPVIIGTGPADMDHSVYEGLSTRLYLLDDEATNIVIEVADAGSSPGTFDDYAPVIDSIQFGPTPSR
jgi:hypothetical protein